MTDFPRQGHAIVVGASVAGLFAGRILADYFDRVTLIDKEPLNGGATPRKAVPQGNHVHGILPPTYDVLKRFLPQVIDDLLADGARLFDGGSDFRFFVMGNWLTQGETGQTLIASTRPLFEHHLRRNVAAFQNIEILCEHRFKQWLSDEDGKRITGVEVESANGEQHLGADLVVDARGRASTLPDELAALGSEPTPEERVGIDLGYTSRLFRAPGFDDGWGFLIINPEVPTGFRGGVAERVENDLWMITLFGYFDDHAPATEEGFLAFARSLAKPDIADFVEGAEPASDFRRYGTPVCTMRRFEQLDAFPERLLAVGDTVCNLNPTYGQGMTKAAREADFLGRLLKDHLFGSGSLDGFSEVFRKGLPNAGAEWAWQLTTGADFAFPQTTGERPKGSGFMGWYMSRLFTRAAKDLDTRKRVFDVTMLIESPDALMRPRMVLHALGL